MYNAAFYFISATLMSIGYGDIYARNYGERAFCIPLALMSGLMIAYGIGSMLTNYDNTEAEFRRKL